MERIVQSVAELEALYGEPLERSVRKQLDRIDDLCRAFIAASPILMIATEGDVSPRGDTPGFVRVVDERTLLIPDRRGNNRTDSLHNIVTHPRIGLLFLIPGVTHTLRVNGDAEIVVDEDLCATFAVDGKPPRTVLRVRVLEAYAHCSRALVRADVWNVEKFKGVPAPTFGEMLEAHTCGFVKGAEVDEDNKTRVPATLY
ncbi:MAG: pyridoxamine 5'-phosphate oxidase family protein [Acidobacteria bacterium]|nr:pyridoxamine 5'-phosphate oxidase family protein [Acidobacteriota bacterium]